MLYSKEKLKGISMLYSKEKLKGIKEYIIKSLYFIIIIII